MTRPVPTHARWQLWEFVGECPDRRSRRRLAVLAGLHDEVARHHAALDANRLSGLQESRAPYPDLVTHTDAALSDGEVQ